MVLLRSSREISQSEISCVVVSDLNINVCF